MLNLQLFIKDKRVDFFEDESIQLTDSIQDARDIGKIFTAVSRDFTVPATLINNNLFKHFYNFDILDGFDPRQKVKASLFQNGFLYKKGFVQLRSVNLQNNKASSYKIFFTGLLGELKSIFKSDKLSDLLSLNKFSHPYNAITIRGGLQSYFDVVNNVPDFTAGNTDMCYPFVSSVNRYAFGADGLRTVDEDGLLTTEKIQTSDLKPALKAIRIIEAIEEKYEITFDSDFLKTDEVFTKLYLWLNKSKGVLSDETKFDVSFLIPAFDFVSGNQVLNLSSETINTNANISSVGSFEFTSFNFEYQVAITGSGEMQLKIIDGNTSQPFAFVSENVEDETLFISGKFESTYGNSNTWRPTLQIITESPEITNINIDLVVNKSQRVGEQVFDETGNYELGVGEIAATSDVNVSLQIPSMLILDFLNSIFKTFNLTALVQNNGSIKVQPLDEFYAEGKIMDITNQIDINKSEVKRFEPYKDINFEFEKAESFLMVKREKLVDDVFGNLNYVIGADDPSKLIGGGSYDIKPKFHKILPERLRFSNNTLSAVMYSWYVNEDQEPLSNQPVLFYTKREELTGSNLIQFQSGENLSSIISPANVKEDLSQTINYGSEIDEYTLEVNTNSLFNNFYRNSILRTFSVRSKILKVKAYLNADFILNYELNDTFIINGRKFNINTLDVNLGTGEASLELRNIFDISPIVNPDTPNPNQLNFSSGSQTEDDASGSYTLNVFSNVSWNITESSDFISVSPTSSTGGSTITVTYTENPKTSTRSGIITLTGGGITREHVFTQTGKVVELTIGSASNTVTTPSGSYTLEVTSNSEWYFSSNKPWCSVSPTSRTGNSLTISYDQNLASETREALIQVSAGTITRTHTLTQQAQYTSQLFPRTASVRRSNKASACSTTATQDYFANDLVFTDITIMFFDENGINRVSAGFYASGTDVLEFNNNGEVINVLTC